MKKYALPAKNLINYRMKTGEKAPDFTLKNQNNEEISLKDYKGKKVLLVFYPKDDSPVCSTQLCEYSKGLDDFEELGISILAVSTDSAESHKAFAEKRNLRFQLLSDVKKQVSKNYGVLGVFGFTKRAVILIDEEGNILYENVKLPVFYQKKTELIETIKSLIKSKQSEK